MTCSTSVTPMRNPAGNILMGHDNGNLNDGNIEKVPGPPYVAGVLTRLTWSSVADGPAAIVVSGRAISALAPAPRSIGSVAGSGKGLLDDHDRFSQATDPSGETWGIGPDEFAALESPGSL